ncbi:hypothetical protein MBLNU457_g2962t1 [Dothideomycetes sp. NU457]
MKTSAVLTVLALGALTAQVGATPAKKHDLAQAKADVAHVRHDKHKPVQFCEKYMHGKKKTTSPIKGVPVKRLSKACATITNSAHAAQKSRASKAAAEKSAAAAKAGSSADSKSANPLTMSASTIDPSATPSASAASMGSAAPRSSPASSSAVVTSAPGKTMSSMASGATSATDSIRSMTSGEATPTDSGVPVITNISQANHTIPATTYSQPSSSSATLTSSSTSSAPTPTRTTVCVPCDKNTTLVGYGLSVRNDATNAGGYLLVPQGVDSAFALVAGAPSQGYSPLPFKANDDDELTAGDFVMAMGADGTLQMVAANSTHTPLTWDLDYDDCGASFTVTNGSGSYDAMYLQLSGGKYAVRLGNEPTMANATQPAYIDLAPICAVGNMTAPANMTAPSRRRML